jgi:hypothetical protein
MSNLQKSDDVAAVFTSDWHASHTAPIARSVEDDWYNVMWDAMSQPLEYAKVHRVPLFFGGDLFDRWNANSELTNFMIDLFRYWKVNVHGIPGQHDLPNHDIEQMHKSAYGSLVKAGVINHLSEPTKFFLDICNATLQVYPFQWGQKLHGPAGDGTFDIALCHRYIWKKNCGYPGAPEEDFHEKVVEDLRGYRVAVFGDNHKGFLTYAGGSSKEWDPYILNCGGLMRRKIDEVSYQPHFGVLRQDGSVYRVALDVSKDQFIDVSDAIPIVEKALELAGFVGSLKQKNDEAIDFVQTLKAFLRKNKVGRLVKELIEKAVNE